MTYLLCEKIFEDTHYRTAGGRFVVSLPFRNFLPNFPESRDLAMNRVLSLKTKLAKQLNFTRNIRLLCKSILT